ncbi:MAG TPA: S8 family serine peptidase [Gemmataceae bacterium]|nr:S8 family serine peptidase [Gemmataceae bacterium]
MPLRAFLSSWLGTPLSRLRKRRRLAEQKHRHFRKCSCRPVLECLEDRLPAGDLSGELGLFPLSFLLGYDPFLAAQAPIDPESEPEQSPGAAEEAGDEDAEEPGELLTEDDEVVVIGPLPGPGPVEPLEPLPFDLPGGTTVVDGPEGVPAENGGLMGAIGGPGEAGPNSGGAGNLSGNGPIGGGGLLPAADQPAPPAPPPAVEIGSTQTLTWEETVIDDSGTGGMGPIIIIPPSGPVNPSNGQPWQPPPLTGSGGEGSAGTSGTSGAVGAPLLPGTGNLPTGGSLGSTSPEDGSGNLPTPGNSGTGSSCGCNPSGDPSPGLIPIDNGGSGIAPAGPTEPNEPDEPAGPDGPDGPGFGGPPGGLTVTLQVPEVTNRTTPSGATVTIVLSPTFPADVGIVDGAVDVDVNHNGTFDESERAFAAIELDGTIGGPHNVIFNDSLTEGIYQLRARVRDSIDREFASSVVTMRVDLHAGYLGSDALRQLYADYVLATTGQLDPVWSNPYWGTDEGDLYYYETPKDSSVLPEPRTSLSLEEFYEEFHQRFVHDSQERVLVNVRSMTSGGLAGLRTGLEGLGMRVVVVTPAQQTVTGYLPIGQIPAVIHLPDYASMTPVYPPVRRIGSFTSEGDSVMRSDVFRTSTGVTGAGITVGVISDSANQVGGGIVASQATGDLTANVGILLDGNPGGSDEGRAMMEIVQDIAPGSRVLFHTADNGPNVFANGIQALAGAGARVIVDDIVYFNQPIFNDGIVAQAVEQVAATGVTYVSAAGNAADIGYDSPWRAVAGMVGSISGNFHDLGGGDILQNITLNVGEQLILALTWDNAYLEGGSPLPQYQVMTDLDFFVTNAAGTMILASAIDNNAMTDEAFELLTFTNNGSFGTNSFALAIQHVSGPAPTRVRWVGYGDDPQAQGQGGPTITGTPLARSTIAVGAANWNNPTVPESFTSLGGPQLIFFDINGNRLPTPEIRFKPEVTGPDGVSTSFFSAPPPGNQFFGTSAAAPHVAGLVALLLEETPCATPVQITQHLMQTALDIGAPGVDPLTGAGMVQTVALPFTCLPPTGDAFEPNDTSDRAAVMGVLSGTQTLQNLSIRNHPNGLPDYDWFRWTAGTSGAVTVTVTEGIPLSDLELFLFTLQGNTLVLLASNTTPNANTRSVSATVAAGQVLLVEVKGRNSSLGVMDQDTYELEIGLS